MHKFGANIKHPLNPILINKSTHNNKCVSGYKDLFVPLVQNGVLSKLLLVNHKVHINVIVCDNV